MSRQNKVNKTNYDQAGRLTPDEMARERMNRRPVTTPPRRDRVIGKVRERASTGPRSGREE
jgi:hypothetical protein